MPRYLACARIARALHQSLRLAVQVLLHAERLLVGLPAAFVLLTALGAAGEHAAEAGHTALHAEHVAQAWCAHIGIQQQRAATELAEGHCEVGRCVGLAVPDIRTQHRQRPACLVLGHGALQQLAAQLSEGLGFGAEGAGRDHQLGILVPVALRHIRVAELLGQRPDHIVRRGQAQRVGRVHAFRLGGEDLRDALQAHRGAGELGRELAQVAHRLVERGDVGDEDQQLARRERALEHEARADEHRGGGACCEFGNPSWDVLKLNRLPMVKSGPRGGRNR